MSITIKYSDNTWLILVIADVDASIYKTARGVKQKSARVALEWLLISTMILYNKV